MLMSGVIQTLVAEKECASQLSQPAEDFVRLGSSVCVVDAWTDVRRQHALKTPFAKMENAFKTRHEGAEEAAIAELIRDAKTDNASLIFLYPKIHAI